LSRLERVIIDGDQFDKVMNILILGYNWSSKFNSHLITQSIDFHKYMLEMIKSLEHPLVSASSLTPSWNELFTLKTNWNFALKWTLSVLRWISTQSPNPVKNDIREEDVFELARRTFLTFMASKEYPEISKKAPPFLLNHGS
jgi:hypothetical protein